MSDAAQNYPMPYPLPEAHVREGRPAFTVTDTDVTIGPLQDGRIWSLTNDAGMAHDGCWPEALLVRIAVRHFRVWQAGTHPDWTLDLDAGEVLAARGIVPMAGVLAERPRDVVLESAPAY